MVSNMQALLRTGNMLESLAEPSHEARGQKCKYDLEML